MYRRSLVNLWIFPFFLTRKLRVFIYTFYNTAGHSKLFVDRKAPIQSSANLTLNNTQHISNKFTFLMMEYLQKQKSKKFPSILLSFLLYLNQTFDLLVLKCLFHACYIYSAHLLSDHPVYRGWSFRCPFHWQVKVYQISFWKQKCIWKCIIGHFKI